MYKNINDYEQLYLISENEDSKSILYDKYRPIVLALAEKYYSCINSKADIEDFIQEGYIGIENAIKSFKDSAGVLFYTFCTVCIERQIQSYYRKLTNKKNEMLNKSYSLDIEFDDFSLIETVKDDKYINNPEDYINDNDLYNKLIKFKNDLDFKYSLVFELRANGFKYSEISKLLGISISTSENYMRYCKLKLKQLIY